MKKLLFIALLVVVSASLSPLFAQKKKAQAKETIELAVIYDDQLAKDIEEFQKRIADNDGRFILETTALLGNIAHSMFTGAVVDAGTDLLKQSIEKSNAKYKAEWIASISKDFFYKRVSSHSALDPSGMQVGGFKATRIIQGENRQDTAFYFSAKIKDAESIVQTSRFTLALDTLLIDLSKTRAKFPKKKTFNLSVEVKITASWVNDGTQYYSDQEMGVFTIDLKNMKYNPDHPVVILTGNDELGKLYGSCFIIPRSSFGMFTKDGRYKPYYGLGEYTMAITVKEQTNYKNVVKDFFNDYTIKVIDTYGKSIKESKIIETGIEIEIPGVSTKSDAEK